MRPAFGLRDRGSSQPRVYCQLKRTFGCEDQNRPQGDYQGQQHPHTQCNFDAANLAKPGGQRQASRVRSTGDKQRRDTLVQQYDHRKRLPSRYVMSLTSWHPDDASNMLADGSPVDHLHPVSRRQCLFN